MCNPCRLLKAQHFAEAEALESVFHHLRSNSLRTALDMHTQAQHEPASVMQESKEMR